MENRVWFSEFKFRKGSPLKPIWRLGCGVTFTSDFGNRTRHVLDPEALNVLLDPFGPFMARDKSCATFYEALVCAAECPKKGMVPICDARGRVMANVFLV